MPIHFIFQHYFLCFCNLMLSKKNRKNDDPPSLSQILPGILSIGEYMAANLRARKKHGISQYVVKANVTSIFFKIYPIHISLDVSFLDFFLEKELKGTSTNLNAVCTYLLYNVGHNVHKISKKINLGKMSEFFFQ